MLVTSAIFELDNSLFWSMRICEVRIRINTRCISHIKKSFLLRGMLCIVHVWQTHTLPLQNNKGKDCSINQTPAADKCSSCSSLFSQNMWLESRSWCWGWGNVPVYMTWSQWSQHASPYRSTALIYHIQSVKGIRLGSLNLHSRKRNSALEQRDLKKQHGACWARWCSL